MHKLVQARVPSAAPVGRRLPRYIRLRRRSCFAPLFGLAVLLMAAQARGEAPDSNFPNRPIRIIVAVPAGGGVDLSTRIAAEALHQVWGQPVTVENRTGGGNNIAGEMVANAEPDGYTLLATPPSTSSRPTPLSTSSSTMIPPRSSRSRSWRSAPTCSR